MRFRGSWLALALAAFAFALPARAQQPGSPVPQNPVHVQPGQLAPQKPAKPLPQEKPMRIRVNVVRLPVTVRGPHGNLALDLGPEDFQVYDNGNLEHILHFDVGGDPISVVMVVENSNRVAALLPAVRKTGIVFTQSVMGGNGEGAIITFGDTTQLAVPFTFDHDKLEKAVNDIKPVGDGSHLYDALARAIGMLENQPENRRRVIVAVSESTDTGSLAKLGSVLRDAQLANIAIYTVGLSSTAAKMRAAPSQYAGPSFGPPGTFSHPGYPGVPQTPSTMQEQSGNINLLALVETLVKMGVNLVSPEALKAASAATGGDHISTFHDRSIQDAMYRVGQELHAEYTLAYQAPKGPSGYHFITVKVARPGYTVRTRPGYFLAPPGGSTGGQ